MRRLWMLICAYSFRKSIQRTQGGVNCRDREMLIRCLRKDKFASEQACLDSIALQVAQKRVLGRISLLTYKCRFCNGWHKTSKKKVQRSGAKNEHTNDVVSPISLW